MKTPLKLRLLRGGLNALAKVSEDTAGELAVRIFSTPRRVPRPDWEKRIVAQGQPLRLHKNLRATSWGDQARPIVLLVHGWEGRGSQLALLVEPLLAKGYRIIALDGPAHGDSPGSRTNMRLFSLVLGDVARELGGLSAVVAHSFGAGATVVAMSTGAPIARAVVVASPSRIRWITENFRDGLGLSAEVYRGFKRRLQAWSGVDTDTIDLAALAGAIGKPGLIVHDPLDREVPFSNAQDLARGWPEARLLALEKVGHRRILKAPAFIAATVDFLGPVVSPS